MANLAALTSFIDSEFMFSPVGTKHEQYLPSLETRMPMPCDACPLMNKCADNGTDCTAFRRWTRHGDYKQKNVGRLLKAFDLNDD